tara:strand:- start:1937 stop:2365 length:429 start_codon:yes stop_codon:yes gene_type:complete
MPPKPDPETEFWLSMVDMYEAGISSVRRDFEESNSSYSTALKEFKRTKSQDDLDATYQQSVEAFLALKALCREWPEESKRHSRAYIRITDSLLRHLGDCEVPNINVIHRRRKTTRRRAEALYVNKEGIEAYDTAVDKNIKIA